MACLLLAASDMYLRRTNAPDIEARIVRDVAPDRFRKITHSTLEGLAKRELNLSALVGKSAEARERRLVPEVIEDFFVRDYGDCHTLSKSQPETALADAEKFFAVVIPYLEKFMASEEPVLDDKPKDR